jgi:hypothetical protein
MSGIGQKGSLAVIAALAMAAVPSAWAAEAEFAFERAVPAAEASMAWQANMSQPEIANQSMGDDNVSESHAQDLGASEEATEPDLEAQPQAVAAPRVQSRAESRLVVKPSEASSEAKKDLPPAGLGQPEPLAKAQAAAMQPVSAQASMQSDSEGETRARAEASGAGQSSSVWYEDGQFGSTVAVPTSPLTEDRPTYMGAPPGPTAPEDDEESVAPAAMFSPGADQVTAQASVSGVTWPSVSPAAAVMAAAGAVGASAAAGFIFVPGWRTAAWRALKVSPLAFLFSRIAKDEVLDHARRSELCEFVRQNPGERVENVRRALGWANGTLRYHLKVLCEKNLVRKITLARVVRLVPAGPKVDPGPYIAPQHRRLLDAVAARPGAKQRTLGEAVGMSERMVSYHVHRLAAEGLLTIRRENGANRCYPAQ